MKAAYFKYSVEAEKRQREKSNIRWLYIWAVVLGDAAIPWAAWTAYGWRGYKAVGGEVLLPVLAVMIVAFVRQVAGIRKEIKK